MAWIFQPYHPNVTFNGQVVYPMQKYSITDQSIKYIESIQLTATKQMAIKRTGFVDRVIQLNDIKYHLFSFTFMHNSPKWLIENIRMLLTSCNSSAIPINFYDNFFTGTSTNPILYYCRCLNSDFADNNVLFSTGALTFYAIDAAGNPDIILEFQKVVNIPPSTLQWDLQIDNTSVLHEYQRRV